MTADAQSATMTNSSDRGEIVMDKTYVVKVFGKAGCAKCKTLNKRLDTLLAKDEWSDFDKQYCDVETADGLLDFCRAECINPNRIPALVVAKRDADDDEGRMLLNPTPDERSAVYGNSKLYTYLGLQTDYTDVGKGLIKPNMLTAVLEEARSA